MRLRDVGLLAWELPQNVLGACWFAAESALSRVSSVRRDRGRLFIETRGTAVSLGLFVFWTAGENRWFWLDERTADHEFGHTFQSRMLGPLYLPLVGVPSVLRVLYAVVFREVTGTRWEGYFDGYPEDWADRLGGVARPRRGRE